MGPAVVSGPTKRGKGRAPPSRPALRPGNHAAKCLLLQYLRHSLAGPPCRGHPQQTMPFLDVLPQRNIRKADYSAREMAKSLAVECIEFAFVVRWATVS